MPNIRWIALLLAISFAAILAVIQGLGRFVDRIARREPQIASYFFAPELTILAAGIGATIAIAYNNDPSITPFLREQFGRAAPSLFLVFVGVCLLLWVISTVFKGYVIYSAHQVQPPRTALTSREALWAYVLTFLAGALVALSITPLFLG